jgi:hypothetical protein
MKIHIGLYLEGEDHAFAIFHWPQVPSEGAIIKVLGARYQVTSQVWNLGKPTSGEGDLAVALIVAEV